GGDEAAGGRRAERVVAAGEEVVEQALDGGGLLDADGGVCERLAGAERAAVGAQHLAEDARRVDVALVRAQAREVLADEGDARREVRRRRQRLAGEQRAGAR